MPTPSGPKVRRGQAILLLTIGLIPMVGLLGLVTDIGYMHFVKKAAQKAADAAALSAVSRFHSEVGGSTYTCTSASGSPYVLGSAGLTPCVSNLQCPSNLTTATNAVESACLYAKQNGFWPWTQIDPTHYAATNQNVIIDANTASSGSPPPMAPNIHSAVYYVSVRVTQRVPQLFSAVLGNTYGMVAARATGALTPAQACIYVLDPVADGAYYQNGSTTVTSGCGIYVNSSSSQAMTNSGNSIVNAPEYDIHGYYDWHGTITPTPNTGIAPAPDPLAGLAPPPPCSTLGGCNAAGCSAGSTTPYTVNTTGTQDVPPGVYCGGIWVKKGTANFTGGTYILVGGGIGTQDTNSIVTGGGFFYNTYDSNHAYAPVNFNANSNVSLEAPTSGDFKAILVMQDRTCCSGTMPLESFQGGPDAKFEGAIYMPKSEVQFAGNPTMTTAKYTIIVVRRLDVLGTSNIANDYSEIDGGSPIKQVGLIE